MKKVNHFPQVISHLEELTRPDGTKYTRCMITPVGNDNEILMEYSQSLSADSADFPEQLMKVLTSRMWTTKENTNDDS